jgi:adenylate cyclase
MTQRLAHLVTLVQAMLNRMTDAVSSAGEPRDVRLRKATLMFATLIFMPAGFIWGAIYFAAGATIPAIIPLSYSIVSALSLAYFFRTRQFQHFRTAQLLLILALPVALMASLGGFVPSSAVMVWSFLCPMGALLFAGRRQSWLWLGAYLAALALSGLADRGLQAHETLPQPLVVVFFVLNIGMVSVLVFAIMSFFDAQRDHLFRLLQAEQATSERLLLNALPQEIIPALKAGEPTAHRFDSASILFADIVNFTSVSTRHTPEEMVTLLNQIFSHFDTLVERYRVEKIRTIGDNYMVVSGVPTPRPDHAHALAMLALDMIGYIEDKPWGPESDLNFRVGMSTGPMVGAVIGHSKFHYDVWGDCVNMASRMESHGVPGKIQLTPEIHALLKDDFVCQPRGLVEVKGVGPMETWFLTAGAASQ